MPQQRVVHVDDSSSISTLAKSASAADSICEKQPIYVHWFGLEMLKAYESAKSQINQSNYPIEIELDGDTYKIEQDSLQHVTRAIETATPLCTNTTIKPGFRGFKGCPNIRHTEAALTSLVSRALDRFIFPDQTTGACLHQAPSRRMQKNPEKPDVYIVPFPDRDFYPGEPGVLSDWKLKVGEFDIADRESTLYSGTGVEEGCKDKFPVLIGIPGTPNYMELQLHVNIHSMFWKLVVASGDPWDGALLCTLKAGIEHLIQNSFFTRSAAFDSPVPFKDMDEYTILGQRQRVFFNKIQKTVYKFFDVTEDDFFHPSILHDLIDKVTVLPDIKLSPPYSDDVRVYTLAYTYVEGKASRSYDLKAFVGVVEMLSKMHRYGFVHGDIRLNNMVFPEDGKSYLIDFDFVGKNDSTSYAASFNHGLCERHKEAVCGRRMMFTHDRSSLAYIINTSDVVSSAANKQLITTKLKDRQCSLEDIAKLLEDF